MRIFFLGGGGANVLVDWLEQQGEDVVYKEEKITYDYIKKLHPDFIISYNYKFLISKEIIDYLNGNVINLHISLLPWNRGAHPNIWSLIEDTPKGVTIHYIDEGIDTGNIIVRKEVNFDEEKETLKSSYEILHREIQSLFIENWGKIKNGLIGSIPQTGNGSIHFKKEFSIVEPYLIDKGWYIPIREFKDKFHKRSIKNEYIETV